MVRCIRLTSNLICIRLAPLGSLGPPPTNDKWNNKVGPLGGPHHKSVRTVLTSSVLYIDMCVCVHNAAMRVTLTLLLEYLCKHHKFVRTVFTGLVLYIDMCV